MFPSVLQNALRSEFAGQTSLHACYRQTLLSSRKDPNGRCFSSLPRLQAPLHQQARPPIDELKKAKSRNHGETKKPSFRNWRDPKSRPSLGQQSPPQPSQKKKNRDGWQVQKDALQEKFRGGWNPQKKLSPDAVDGIRHLHAMKPNEFTTPVLAAQFKVSPEAIRRILKSNWRPSETEMEDRHKRWEKRHNKIWSQMAELGLRPKRKGTGTIDDANILYEDSAGKA